MKRMSVAMALLSFSAGLTAAARAQDNIDLSVGAARVRGGLLAPYRSTMRQIVTSSDGTVLNARQTLGDSLYRIRGGGRDVWERVVTLYRFDGGVYAVDTTRFEPETLAPLYSVERVANTLAWQRTFANGEVFGTLFTAAAGGSGLGMSPDSAPRFKSRLSRPVFDYFGTMGGLLLATMPLATGNVLRFPTFAERGDSVIILSFRVVGKERVEAGPGVIKEAWAVEGQLPDGPITYWVTKEPPFVLKYRQVVMQNGKPFKIFTALMI